MSWVLKKEKKREEKGNWDIQSFLTVDGLSRLTLLGFRHTAPRPPFSLSPRQAKSRGKSKRGKKRRQMRKLKETKRDKVKRREKKEG